MVKKSISKNSISEYFASSGYTSFYSFFLDPSKFRPGKKSEILAICPFHDDHNPSLSFNAITGYFNCFTCNTTGDIFSFIQKTKNINFSQAIDLINKTFNCISDPKKKQLKKKQTVDAEYQYHDEKGRICHTAVRFSNPKGFAQKTTGKNNKTIWSLNNIKTYLFNLPQVIAHQNILYVEGEKDVRTLKQYGFTATTNPLGVNGWKDEYKEYLTGKNVILIPDNDKPGMKLMAQVAESIQNCAMSVKILILPGLADKEDVTDWFKNSRANTAIRLRDLIFEESRSITEVEQLFVSLAEPDPISGTPKKPPEYKFREHNPFPMHIFKGADKNFIDIYSKNLESPPQYFGMAYLTMLGHMISPHVRFSTELDIQPRLYTLILGQSGTVRKSTAMTLVHKLFNSALKNTEHEFKCIHGINSAEAFESIFRIADEEKAKSVDLAGKAVETPPEDLINVLIVLSDEFGALMKKANIKNSTLLENLNQLYEKNIYSSATKQDWIEIENIHLSILGATTPTAFSKMFTTDATEDGFMNRLCIIPGEAYKKVLLPPKIPQADKDELRDELLQILNWTKKGLEYEFTENAMKFADKFYQNLPNDIDATRLESLMFRMCLLLAVCREQQVINTAIIKDAADFVIYQYHVRNKYRPITAHNDEAKLEQKMVKHLKANKNTSLALLKRSVHYERYSTRLFDTILRALEKSEYIELSKRGKSTTITVL